MVRGSKAVVGILAGGGSLPREIADVLHAEGQNPVIVGLEGEVRPRDFAGHDFTLVNWGRIGQLLRTFKQKGVTDLVIVGSVTRPDLRAIRTDVGFWWNLPRAEMIASCAVSWVSSKVMDSLFGDQRMSLRLFSSVRALTAKSP